MFVATAVIETGWCTYEEYVNTNKIGFLDIHGPLQGELCVRWCNITAQFGFILSHKETRSSQYISQTINTQYWKLSTLLDLFVKQKQPTNTWLIISESTPP